MREHQESSPPAVRSVDICTQDFLAWAHARERVLIESDTQSTPSDPKLAAIAQPLPDAAIDNVLERALAASCGPADEAVADPPPDSVHSFAAARAKRRFLGGSAMLALLAAASFLLLIRNNPHEVATDPTVAELQDPLRFRLDVQSGSATMRGASDRPDEHRFAADDRIIIGLVPFERTRVDVEFRVFVVVNGQRRTLSWEDRPGDPTLGDREILGSAADLGPGEWRLELEAVERGSGAVRWRDAMTLQIQTDREM